ncbi:MAG TPA: hypothetical protein VG937_01070 [Polyangiaceae bacterium]|nr:hypothetical protein [Polyangiaceae bacterium]
MSIRKIAALIPVCALMAACGGEATPEAKAPEAAATEAKPAEGDAAKPAEGDAAKPEGDAAKPEGDAK